MNTPSNIQSNEAVLLYRLNIVKEEAKKTINRTEQNRKQGQEHLRCAEYQFIVNCLFIEMFMNKSKNITRENVDEMEANSKEYLTYFENWHKAQLARKQVALRGDDSYKKQFLSPQTYNNLRIIILGFFPMPGLS